jgi:hypothetical protein
MAANDYTFTTTWRVRSTCEEITTILSKPVDLARWWPSVYLAVRKEGERVHLHTRGWLPYTLKWSFVTTRRKDPHGFSLVAEGDFVGEGDWTFTQEGEEVVIVYDWRVRADKPVLRWFSRVFKPIFSMNHHWAMARGQESLELELARRRGELVAAPPLAPRTEIGLAGIALVAATALLLALR